MAGAIDASLKRLGTDHVDLYLPDDTHWSTVGHALAATLVEQRLRALGVFAAP